jgi:hypothetical protein
MPNSLLAARAKHAGTVRHHGPDSPQAQNARRELAEAQITTYIERVVAEAPPLTPAQRDRISALLRGGDDHAA